MPKFFQAAALAASAGIALTLAITPATAAAKPNKITLPASAIKDESTKLCMPRDVLSRSVDRSLPKTICQTKSDWETAGLTIVVK